MASFHAILINLVFFSHLTLTRAWVVVKFTNVGKATRLSTSERAHDTEKSLFFASRYTKRSHEAIVPSNLQDGPKIKKQLTFGYEKSRFYVGSEKFAQVVKSLEIGQGYFYLEFRQCSLSHT